MENSRNVQLPTCRLKIPKYNTYSNFANFQIQKFTEKSSKYAYMQNVARLVIVSV